jgi:hypothetical protein
LGLTIAREQLFCFSDAWGQQAQIAFPVVVDNVRGLA